MFGSLPWIAIALFVFSMALWKWLPASRSRFRATFILLCLGLLFQAGAAAGTFWHLDVHIAREMAQAFIELAAVQVVLGVVFSLAVARMGLPRFVTEAAVIAGYIGVLFELLYRLGVNVTGIFATSAVAAAVLGLSLQDMLTNIAGGIALQFEGDISPDDFIRCGDTAGWVRHVRLRHTAIETPDGDRILLPNSILTRSPLTILPRSRRTFIPFAVPYARNPQELIDAVTAVLRTSPIPEIAADPKPFCIILEMAPGHIRYAAVVWILNPGYEALAVSTVLKHIYFSLARAGIPLAEITNLLEMKTTMDGPSQRTTPLEILHQTPIFRLLEEPELTELGARLHHLSFAPGERIIRQGADGESMYFVSAGRVTINYVGSDGSENQVAVLGPGDFFGETSLLTGAAHNASAMAATRVDCYKLDKSGLEGIIGRRPELVEDMAVVMAHRQEKLANVRDAFDRETSRLKAADNQPQLLARIRRFFGLESDTISRV